MAAVASEAPVPDNLTHGWPHNAHQLVRLETVFRPARRGNPRRIHLQRANAWPWSLPLSAA